MVDSEIYIRAFVQEDAEALLELNTSNREIFDQYTPVIKDDSFFTLDSHRGLIDYYKEARKQGSRYDFGIFKKHSAKLIGILGLYKFNSSEKCILGYSMDKGHYGKGYATEAVKMALDFAFKEAGIHRVEAGVMPRNKGSMRVLEKVGFVQEGLARDYLKIQGIWEDHYIYSLLETDSY